MFRQPEMHLPYRDFSDLLFSSCYIGCNLNEIKPCTGSSIAGFLLTACWRSFVAAIPASTGSMVLVLATAVPFFEAICYVARVPKSLNAEHFVTVLICSR
jgi:hypothetical protein